MFGSLECFPFSEQCKVIMKCDRLRGRGETMLLSEKSSRFFFLRDLLRVPPPAETEAGAHTVNSPLTRRKNWANRACLRPCQYMHT